MFLAALIAVCSLQLLTVFLRVCAAVLVDNDSGGRGEHPVAAAHAVCPG